MESVRIETNDRVEKCAACGAAIMPSDPIWLVGKKATCGKACAENMLDRIEQAGPTVNTKGAFARLNGLGNYDLLDEDGCNLVILPQSDGWPLVWPEDSDLSAYYEHVDGLKVSHKEFRKLRKLVPVR